LTLFSDRHLPDLQDILKSVGAEEILPRFRRLEAADIAHKESPRDLVTAADIAAETAIAARIRRMHPSALIVGEEAVSEDASLLDGLAEAPLAFVIDPVDGTFNFASAMPLFGTMLAVVAGGECVSGIIHYPVTGESLVAMRGAGARLIDHDGAAAPLRVANPVPLAEMVGTISWGFMDEPLRSRVAGNMAKIAMTFALRCSAWEYRLAAAGKVHFIGGQKLMPWDHLAGVLIHAEAGGYSARLDGTPYRPGMTDGGLISAPDHESWRMIRAEIIEA